MIAHIKVTEMDDEIDTDINEVLLIRTNPEFVFSPDYELSITFTKSNAEMLLKRLNFLFLKDSLNG